jgi:hypothetical protein
MQYRYRFVAAMAVGIALAQLNTPGSYNLGAPQTYGARVPESNPGTAIGAPQSAAPSSPGATAPAIGASPAASAPTGPAYSFGAAPAPVVSPGR